VPDYVATQCYYYMGLTNARWWDIATLFLGHRREFAIFHLKRNQVIIDNLVEAGRDFWENHVVPRVPPEIDASEASKALLRHLYPDSRGDVLPAPDNALEWRGKLERASARLKHFEEEKKLAQHHLEMFTGEADSLLFDDGARFDWKRQKDRKVVDWEGIARYWERLVEPDIILNVHDEYTTTKPGIRVARLWPPKKEKN
jgi:predicted phage-related endonuclease